MVTLSGKFVYEDNTPVANGVLMLTLSQPCSISGTAQIAPLRKVIQLDASGNIPGSTQVYGNDALTPAGTTYTAALYTGVLNPATGLYGPGAQLFSQNWSLTGASVAVDTLTPTTNGASYVAPVTSIGLTMPGEFSVSNSPVTSAGTIVVAKVNQSANQVYAGPSTGAAAAPGFRALVDADIPTTLAGHTLTSPTITNPSTTGTDSGAEILKNKTLTGAAMGNSVQLLTKIDNSGAITGNSGTQNVFSYTMPANSMQAGKGIRIRAFVLQGGVTNAATMAFNFGATNISLGAMSAAGVLTGQWEFLVFNKSAAQNAQIITINGFGGTTAFNSTSTTSAVDTTASVTITLTFNVANTTTMTPILFLVEQIQ